MIDDDPVGNDGQWRHLDTVEKRVTVHRWVGS